jgi:hypothetical protein
MPITTSTCMVMVTATPSHLVHNDMHTILKKKVYNTCTLEVNTHTKCNHERNAKMLATIVTYKGYPLFYEFFNNIIPWYCNPACN